MNILRRIKRQMFDIRQGEHLRTWAMFFYLLCVLFAYYILKPVSRAMFLNRFDIDRLPSLYILIAAFGGLLAYSYSKLAVRASLRTAVFWATSLSVACLVVMWWLIRMRFEWMIYVLNVWVSLFAIVLVAQGWLVASNLFNPREAKRLYPLLGMGMVLGAAFGGTFTSKAVVFVGTTNLLLASAFMVILAYVAFRIAISQGGETVGRARAAAEEEADFSFRDVARDIAHTRQLQVIIGIMMVTFIVDVLVEYQFQRMAKASFSGDELTAFFGQFYGLYLNAVEFVFQLVLTGAVVRWFGVGGTLQIMPTAIMLASTFTLAAPGVTSTSAVRLTEAATRYTLNRTGMELLYLPLPAELRNRIKAFIDIFVDRFSRGLGGVLLIFLTVSPLNLSVRQLAGVVMAFALPWFVLSYLARREYVATVRKRLASRRLDFGSIRVSVNDLQTIRLLESTAAGENPRQAAYALGLLAEAPNYDPRPALASLFARNGALPLEVRQKAYEIAAALRWDGLREQASSEVKAARGGDGAGLAPTAAPYLLAVSSDRARLAAELLDDSNPRIVMGALDALQGDRELAEDLIGREWLARVSASPDPRRRALAAAAIAVRGDQGLEALHRLLEDPHPDVAAAACRAAGVLRNRTYLYSLFNGLGNSRVRGEAISAMAAYGPSITGTLSDVLLDESVPLRTRRQIPRVLGRIPHQRSVDVLLSAVGHRDLSIRAAVLKALNRLRESDSRLNFENEFVTGQILAEARTYFELNAALAPFREGEDGNGRAARLLARTIEERLKNTLERLFRLLGLRYPPKEIYSAYLAVSGHRSDAAAAAMEFLDNVLERDLKRILIPLLDAPDHVAERGRELFGLDRRTAEQAIRELIRSRDPWLVACAMAAAAELRLRSLAPEIAEAARDSEEEVSEVARSAESVLAALEMR